MHSKDESESPNAPAGIALSGGGIRSATFNLGLLQRLNDLGILDKFDYLSTVSGGGYIGSWWTRYRIRHTDDDIPDEQRFFPKWRDGKTEPPEISHLRRFSNFIAPRVGLTNEMGKAIVTAIAGIAQSLIAVGAMLALILLGFAYVLDGFDAFTAWFVEPPPKWARVFSFTLLAMAIVLILPRLVVQRISKQKTIDRRLNRLNWVQWKLLFLALVFGFFEGVWLIAKNSDVLVATTAATGAVTVSASFAFVMRRLSQITRFLDKNQAIKRRVVAPQILAYVALVLWLIALAVLSVWLQENEILSRRGQLAASLSILLTALLLFHPRRVGMHAFYRSRLNRAYLGDPTVTSTSENAGDDIHITELNKLDRPRHLICATANDILSDTLHNFDRGAFHACFSAEEFFVGRGRPDTLREDGDDEEVSGKWRDLNGDDLTLGSAMTTSGAAFNSVMGSQSKRLGWAVSLLLTALNLRLGLWLPNPSAKERFKWGPFIKALPGLLYFAESISWVYCKLAKDNGNRYLHLSDGGHFENLAVYELIRRKCRYILVSDCGADAEREFADFGNLVRRVRTDFGVDIRLDTSPLVPDERGVSREHFAVGTIRYAKGDKGILLYVKPSLTGDEPGDIRHYAMQNPTFPHESTGDQFYNEAQWEAYRRLGFHTGEHAFAFVKEDSRIISGGAARIFSEARWRWRQIPPSTICSLTRLTRRFDRMQRRWIKEAPTSLCAEIFPEIAPAVATPTSGDDPRSPETMSCLLEVVSFLDELYREANLEDNDSMADMRGWTNIIQRWARVDALRIWWPLLRSLFGNRFVAYIERATTLDQSILNRSVILEEAVDLENASAGIDRAYRDYLRSAAESPDDLGSVRIARLAVNVQMSGGSDSHELVIGLLHYRIDNDECATWHSEHLYVLPGLWRSDWGTRFIGRFLREAANKHPKACFSVRYDWGEPDNRPSLVGLQTLYRPHGFEMNHDEQKPAFIRGPISSEF